MKINYQKMLDDVIEKNKKLNIKPTLLLHACCAPCSSAVLEYLYEHFNITLFFYNPNISPESEFSYRLEELKRLIVEMNFSDIEIVVPDYDNNEFEELAKTTLHSTSAAAACCAKEAGAGKLVLGHYSSRYKSLDTMLEEAREIFPSTELAKEGMKFEIELEKFK